jgi:hypothetical protein
MHSAATKRKETKEGKKKEEKRRALMSDCK